MKPPIYKPGGRALEYAEWAINTYVGCPHRCIYCYAKPLGSHLQPAPRKGLVAALEKQLAAFDSQGSRIHLCFTCDPYPESVEREQGLTRAVLATLRAHGHHWQVLTKAGTLAQRDMDLYRTGDMFGVTLTTPYSSVAAKFEPGAADPSVRMENLKAYHAAGIETWISLEPTIWPADTLWLIDLTAPYTDLYKVGKLNHRQPPQAVDWAKFAVEVKARLESLGKRYSIKADLLAFLPGTAEKA